ncbi:MAG: NAD(P)H:quinone oxidoreductase [Actinobacteria bacterium]|nr:NAD(P)H:quinone oxidoreductase [Actinomycetota bacterium]
MASIGIVYYSMYGHTTEMARTLKQGIEKDGGEAHLRLVPELLPQQLIEDQGVATVDQLDDVEEASVDELPGFDGIIFGSPTRFGNRAAQLSNFLDQTGPLWQAGELHGKTAGFFTGAATMHGGHESTILTMSTYAMHLGMVIVPAGYALGETMGATRTGGSPYGPTHWSPQGGTKDGLSDDESQIALSYAQWFHQVTEKLAA